MDTDLLWTGLTTDELIEGWVKLTLRTTPVVQSLFFKGGTLKSVLKIQERERDHVVRRAP